MLNLRSSIKVGKAFTKIIVKPYLNSDDTNWQEFAEVVKAGMNLRPSDTAYRIPQNRPDIAGRLAHVLEVHSNGDVNEKLQFTVRPFRRMAEQTRAWLKANYPDAPSVQEGKTKVLKNLSLPKPPTTEIPKWAKRGKARNGAQLAFERN